MKILSLVILVIFSISVHANDIDSSVYDECLVSCQDDGFTKNYCEEYGCSHLLESEARFTPSRPVFEDDDELKQCAEDCKDNNPKGSKELKKCIFGCIYPE